MLLDENDLTESSEKLSLDSYELNISINEEGNIQPYRILNHTPSPTYDDVTPPSSPIYAVPFEDYNQNPEYSASLERDKQRTSLLIMSPFFKPSRKPQLNTSKLDEYKVYSSNSSLSSSSTRVSDESCSSWMPVNPKRCRNFSICQNNSSEDSIISAKKKNRLNEFDFLAKLDHQIAELQVYFLILYNKYILFVYFKLHISKNILYRIKTLKTKYFTIPLYANKISTI